MSDALFVGRFQPFHNGHLKVIEDLGRKYEKVVIIIGSAQEKRTENNPFSAGERKIMIKKVLDGKGINYEIHAVKDYFNCVKWVRAIKRLCRFDDVYSTNPWTIRCFEENGIKVKRHKLYRRKDLSGTRIRKMIMKGNKEWHRLVPEEITGYIEKISGKLHPI